MYHTECHVTRNQPISFEYLHLTHNKIFHYILQHLFYRFTGSLIKYLYISSVHKPFLECRTLNPILKILDKCRTNPEIILSEHCISDMI